MHVCCICVQNYCVSKVKKVWDSPSPYWHTLHTLLCYSFIPAIWSNKYLFKVNHFPFRAMRGKNKAAFLSKLKEVIATFCDMIKHECPEGELVAPKYVSCLSVHLSWLLLSSSYSKLWDFSSSIPPSPTSLVWWIKNLSGKINLHVTCFVSSLKVAGKKII